MASTAGVCRRFESAVAGLRYDPADIRLRVTAALVAVNEAATLIDSGANAHLTSDKSLFTGFVRSCRQSVGGIDSVV